MAADPLQHLRLAGRAILLGRRVAMQVDIVHNQARTTGPLLEIFELRELLEKLGVYQSIFSLLQ